MSTTFASLSSAYQMQPQESPTLLYRFPREPLAPQEVFAFHSTSGFLARLACDEDGFPRLLASCSLAPGDRVFFLTLFASYPEYCPLEELLAAYVSHSTTKEQIAFSRTRLQNAHANGTLREEVAPLHAIVTRIRSKVRELGLEIAHLHDLGYLLQPLGTSYLGSPPHTPCDVTRIRHLSHGFPHGHVVAYDPAAHALAYLLTEDHGIPRLFLDAKVTLKEERLLVPLLTAHPLMCSNAHLWASFTYGVVDQQTLTIAETRLREVAGSEKWEYTLRPLRNVLSRLHVKLRGTGLALPSIQGTGYLLVYIPSHVTRKENRRAHI